jgi:MFS family permease
VNGGLHLLRHNPSFRVLWSARAISYLGDSLGLVALLVYVEERTGAALAVALLLFAGDCLPGFLGTLAGAIGDRFDLRSVMIGCELLQGALVVAMAVTLPPLPVLLVLVALRSIVATIFQPASRSAVPALVDDRSLEAANSTLGAGTYGLEALGPLVAAGLFAVTDIRGILVVDAATFAVSAVLLSRLPSLPSATSANPDTLLANARVGLRYMWSAPVVRVIALGFFGVAAFSGVDDVAMVFLARDELHGTDSAAAVLYAGVGIGLVVGYVVLSRLAARVPTLVLLVAGFAIGALGNLLTGLAWAVMAALALQTVRGTGIAALDVGLNTHLQRIVPPPLLGRVFGTLYGAVGVAAGISYGLGGLLLELTNARVTFIAAGTGALIVTAATALALRRAAGRRQDVDRV